MTVDKTKRIICLLAIMSLCFTVSLFAQRRTQVEADIREVKFQAVKTPDFKDNKQPTTDYWCRITALFDIKKIDAGNAKFIDSMDIVWKIVLDDDKGKPMILSQTVTYEDIEKSNGHRACIFIPPKFFKHYQKTNRVPTTGYSWYVELKVNGEKIAFKEETKHKLPDKWYNKTDGNASRSGRYLIPKSKTPFAALDYDYYEVEKAGE